VTAILRPMVTVLINGRARAVAEGADRKTLEESILRALPDAKVVFTGDGSDICEEARRAIADGSRLIVGGGGDGTLSAIAGVLVDSDIPLGILPLGTLNHFAKDLGIPLELDAAIAALATGRTIQVDVGDVNGSLFLNNSGLGLYPVIVHLRELRQSRGIAKWPAALWATIKALARYERLSIRVQVDGQELRRRTPVVFVGNNEYTFEGIQLPARNRLDDGQLSVYIPHAHGRFRLILFSILALFRAPKPDRAFDAFLTGECWIETRHHGIKVSLDGEVSVLQPPLHYRARPKALHVIVPGEVAT
jgi:diacylglycerol kinase family enzyme